MNKQELKAAEVKAIEGLTGAARTAAKKAFYEANKTAIQAANNAEAVAAEAARKAPEVALIAAAAAKGLQVTMTANTGYLKGSSRQDVAVITGNTFAIKEQIKAHGGRYTNGSWIIFADALPSLIAAI